MKRLVIVCVIFSFFISGCVTVEKRGDTVIVDPWKKVGEKIEAFWKKLKGETTEKQTGAREEAVKRYEYKGLTDEIIVERPVVTPSVVNPGDKVKQELQYTLLSPQEGKRFRVLESVVLSSSKDTIELIKRESEKAQGIYLSTVEFTLPADLDPGEYKLISTISIGGQKKTVSGSFKLRRL